MMMTITGIVRGMEVVRGMVVIARMVVMAILMAVMAIPMVADTMAVIPMVMYMVILNTAISREQPTQQHQRNRLHRRIQRTRHTSERFV